MKKLQPSTQYRKDLKRYKNNPKKLEDLKEVLGMLMNEQLTFPELIIINHFFFCVPQYGTPLLYLCSRNHNLFLNLYL